MDMPSQSWIFRARLDRVVDGDTIDVIADGGWHIYTTQRLRLLRCDCPEVRGPERQAGLAATAFVRDWLAGCDVGWPLVLQTSKSDEFGRFLSEVWRRSDGANLSDDLLAAGHARPFLGGMHG